MDIPAHLLAGLCVIFIYNGLIGVQRGSHLSYQTQSSKGKLQEMKGLKLLDCVKIEVQTVFLVLIGFFAPEIKVQLGVFGRTFSERCHPQTRHSHLKATTVPRCTLPKALRQVSI